MTQSYTGGDGFDPDKDGIDIIADKTREAIDEFRQREQARQVAAQQDIQKEEQAVSSANAGPVKL